MKKKRSLKGGLVVLGGDVGEGRGAVRGGGGGARGGRCVAWGVTVRGVGLPAGGHRVGGRGLCGLGRPPPRAALLAHARLRLRSAGPTRARAWGVNVGPGRLGGLGNGRLAG